MAQRHTAVAVDAQLGAAPRASVVIAGDDVYEDLFTASVELQDILIGSGFAAHVRLGMQGAAADAGTSDLIVLYRAMGEFTAEQQDALAEAVRSGCGLIAIHSSNVFGADDAGRTDAAAGTDHASAARRLIGSRFRSHGPRPYESRFTVQLDAEHPITRGIESFEIVHEHYTLDVDPGATVLAWRSAASAASAAGNTGDPAEPLLYTRTLGSGRVCYLQLGHDLRVWREPAVRQIIARAAAWAQRPSPARAHPVNQGGAAMASRSTAGAMR